MQDKKQFPTSIRLSPHSLKQLEMLQRKYGENRTQTIARIIGETFVYENQKKRDKRERGSYIETSTTEATT